MSLSKVLSLAYLNNLPVADLTFDSNAVRQGSIFFALQGARVDGSSPARGLLAPVVGRIFAGVFRFA